MWADTTSTSSERHSSVDAGSDSETWSQLDTTPEDDDSLALPRLSFPWNDTRDLQFGDSAALRNQHAPMATVSTPQSDGMHSASAALQLSTEPGSDSASSRSPEQDVKPVHLAYARAPASVLDAYGVCPTGTMLRRNTGYGRRAEKLSFHEARALLERGAYAALHARPIQMNKATLDHGIVLFMEDQTTPNRWGSRVTAAGAADKWKPGGGKSVSREQVGTVLVQRKSGYIEFMGSELSGQKFNYHCFTLVPSDEGSNLGIAKNEKEAQSTHTLYHLLGPKKPKKTGGGGGVTGNNLAPAMAAGVTSAQIVDAAFRGQHTRPKRARSGSIGFEGRRGSGGGGGGGGAGQAPSSTMIRGKHLTLARGLSTANGTEFINFTDASGRSLGSLAQEDSRYGVTLESRSGDIAEWHRRAASDAPFVEGDLVGFVHGELSRLTTGAEMVGVISRRAMVKGSMPSNKEKWDTVAYAGRAPVRVRVDVRGYRNGDRIMPSGLHDGTAVVAPRGHSWLADISQVVGVVCMDNDDDDDDDDDESYGQSCLPVGRRHHTKYAQSMNNNDQFSLQTTSEQATKTGGDIKFMMCTVVGPGPAPTAWGRRFAFLLALCTLALIVSCITLGLRGSCASALRRGDSACDEGAQQHPGPPTAPSTGASTGVSTHAGDALHRLQPIFEWISVLSTHDEALSVVQPSVRRLYDQEHAIKANAKCAQFRISGFFSTSTPADPHAADLGDVYTVGPWYYHTRPIYWSASGVYAIVRCIAIETATTRQYRWVLTAVKNGLKRSITSPRCSSALAVCDRPAGDQRLAGGSWHQKDSTGALAPVELHFECTGHNVADYDVKTGDQLPAIAPYSEDSSGRVCAVSTCVVGTPVLELRLPGGSPHMDGPLKGGAVGYVIAVNSKSDMLQVHASGGTTWYAASRLRMAAHAAPMLSERSCVCSGVNLGFGSLVQEQTLPNHGRTCTSRPDEVWAEVQDPVRVLRGKPRHATPWCFVDPSVCTDAVPASCARSSSTSAPRCQLHVSSAPCRPCVNLQWQALGALTEEFRHSVTDSAETTRHTYPPGITCEKLIAKHYSTNAEYVAEYAVEPSCDDPEHGARISAACPASCGKCYSEGYGAARVWDLVHMNATCARPTLAEYQASLRTLGVLLELVYDPTSQGLGDATATAASTAARALPLQFAEAQRKWLGANMSVAACQAAAVQDMQRKQYHCGSIAFVHEGSCFCVRVGYSCRVVSAQAGAGATSSAIYVQRPALWASYTGLVFEGDADVVQGVNEVSESACSRMCAQHARCRAFVWGGVEFYCELWSTAWSNSTWGSLKFAPGYSTHFKHTAVSTVPECPPFSEGTCAQAPCECRNGSRRVPARTRFSGRPCFTCKDELSISVCEDASEETVALVSGGAATSCTQVLNSSLCGLAPDLCCRTCVGDEGHVRTLRGCECLQGWRIDTGYCNEASRIWFRGCGMIDPCDGDDGGVPGQSWCFVDGSCAAGRASSTRHFDGGITLAQGPGADQRHDEVAVDNKTTTRDKVFARNNNDPPQNGHPRWDYCTDVGRRPRASAPWPLVLPEVVWSR